MLKRKVHMINTKQQGSALTLIITGIIIVLLAGLIAWRLLTPTNSGNRPAQTTATEQTVIEEWGVKFKPADDLANVLYAKRDLLPIVGKTLPSGTENIVLSTKQLAEASTNCRVDSTTHSALGVVYRMPTQIDAPELFIKQIGNYFYYYKGPQSTCSTQAELELDLKTKLKTSLTTLTEK